MVGEQLQRPTVVGEVADHSAFGGGPAARGRAGAVRIHLPGTDDPEERAAADIAPPLSNAIIDTLGENTSIQRIELLSFAGHDQQEHILTPVIQSEQPDARNESVPPTSQPLADLSVTGRLATAQEQLADALDTHLPPAYGIETASVEFGPLGYTPVPACRLLAKNHHDKPPDNLGGLSPLIQAVRELARASQPHLIQTIVQRNSGTGADYLVTHRSAVYDPAQLAVAHRDYLDIVDHGRQYDLASLGLNAVTSNFRLPIGDYTTRYANRVLIEEAKFKNRSYSKRVWKLFEGLVEYDNLRAMQPGYDPVYEDHDMYARFPVADAALKYFASVVPVYYTDSPWAATGRNPPQITTDSVIRQAAGAEHAVGSPTDAVETPSQTVVNDGSDRHVSLLATAIQVLTEEGADASIVDQDSTSRPDGTSIKDGTVTNVEAEVADVSKPANILINNARAKAANRGVLHVVTDKDAAKTVYNALKQPFKETGDHGVVLYNGTDAVTLDDGSKPVLPATATESRWELSTDGTLLLLAAEQVLASGDAERSVTSFTYDCPKYVTEDGTHKLIDTDDTVIETAADQSTLLTDWTRIRIPFVPSDIHYLDDSQIRYKDGRGLEPYDPTPTWMQATEGKRKLYKAAEMRFISDYTTATADTEFRYDTFEDLFAAWYIARLSLEDPARIDDLVPAGNEFGRALPDYVETKRRTVDGTQRRFLRDRTLVYPRGLQSPDLPFIDDGSDGA